MCNTVQAPAIIITGGGAGITKQAALVKVSFQVAFETISSACLPLSSQRGASVPRP